MAETKGAEVNDEIKAWSGKLREKIELNTSTGSGTPADNIFETFFEEENVTNEDFQKTDNYRTKFVAASTHAYGQLSVEAMTGNKNLQQTSIEIPLDGKNLLSLSVDRHKTYPNHLGDGKPTEKFGVVSVGLEIYAGKNAGQLKKARQEISELALEALK